MRLDFTGTYAGDWPAIAAQVKADAGDRCVRCGHPNGDRLERTYRRETGLRLPRALQPEFDPAVKRLMQCTTHCTHLADGKLRVLTVHHLDGDKGNNRWWNLLALCQVCHLQIQARVIPERPWLFPHTPWFRPYVAGFYAWFHAGRELTREEVLAELDALLALGQPWLYGTGRSA